MTPVERGPKQEAADLPDHQNAGKQGDEPDVQPHIPVENMAEFVSDYTLQFVS